MGFVRGALGRIGAKYRFRRETAQDFKQYVLWHLPAWIVKFDPKRGTSLRTWVNMKVSYAAKDFMRIEMRQRMGLSGREIKRLFVLITGKKKGKTIEQTAKERGIKLKEAKELWEAFETYKRRVPYELLKEER